MKLLSTAVLAWSAGQVQGAVDYEWQRVGYCGLPAVKFQEKVVTTNSHRARRDTTSSEVDAYEECVSKATEEYLASQQEAKGKSFAIGYNEAEAKRALRQLNKACNDMGDGAYDRKRLSVVPYLQANYDTLYAELLNAELNDGKELSTQFVLDVADLIHAVKMDHKRCSNAFSRLAGESKLKRAGEDSVESMKPANSKNENQDMTDAIAEECDDVRVVGGEDATAHAWPWNTYISICGTFYGMMECNICGGTIISNKWILTAAHCVPYEPRGRILIGAHDMAGNDYSAYTLGEMIKHNKWNFPGRFENDIALTSPANYELMQIDFAKSMPVCLPHADNCFAIETTCVVTGWGLTEERGALSDILQVAGVKLMNHDECKTFTGYSKIADTMLCAGFKDGGVDACAGDSGGPLVCRMSSGKSKGAWVLHGIVSWGYGCARPGSPGIYTQVDAYGDWIEEQTQLRADDRLVDGIAPGKCISDVDYTAVNEFMERPAEIENPDLVLPQPGSCNYEMLSAGFQTFEQNSDGSMSLNGDNTRTVAQEEIAMISMEHTGTMPATDCQWVWQNNDPDRFIRLDIATYLMDQCQKYDEEHKLRLKIEYKDDTGTVREVSPCSTLKPIIIQSQTWVRVSFESGHRDFGSAHTMGFQIGWEFKDDTWHCEGEREFSFENEDQVFNIQSPNYPKFYNSQQQCRWMIHSRFDLRVHVKNFNTERQRICDTANDNLIFYLAHDCHTATLQDISKHRIYGVLCGAYKNKFYRINLADAYEANAADPSLSVCMQFIGDNDKRNGKGFNINIEVAKPEVVTTKAPAVTKPPRKKKTRKPKGPRKPKAPKGTKKPGAKKPCRGRRCKNKG